jgi:translation initiation factor 3 subunit C
MSDREGAPAKPAASAKPTSRFLRGAGSESSSDSDSESDDESEMSEEEAKPKRSRFLAGGSDDEESDEDTKRVVKSAKDKRLDEMEASGKLMENALKINDWVAMSNGGSSGTVSMLVSINC